MQSFRKMRFCAVLSLGCRFVCLYSAKFDNHVFTFSVYFVLMIFCLFKYLVNQSTRPLTCVLLLPCLLLEAPRSLVHLVHSSTNLCSSVTLSFITSNLFTCLTRSLVYSHYYIYLPWNRFFSVVPLHRHQE